MPYPYFGPPLIKNCIGHDIMQSLYTILKKKNIKMLILLLSVSEIKHYDPVIKDASVQEGVSVLKCVSVFCTSDPPSADLDQLELPILCDGLRRYLQDLPQPVIPTAVHAQMVHTSKG